MSGCFASYYRIARLGVFYFDFGAICMVLWKLLAGVLLACEMPSTFLGACGRTRLALIKYLATLLGICVCALLVAACNSQLLA